MYKSCSKCGRIHPYNYNCGKREYKETEERKLRATSRWKKKAKQIKEDSQGLCEVCKKEGRYTYEGLEVHHITKLRDDPDLLLDDTNLITLCSYHHKLADAGEIKEEYLRELVKERTKEVQI